MFPMLCYARMLRLWLSVWLWWPLKQGGLADAGSLCAPPCLVSILIIRNLRGHNDQERSQRNISLTPRRKLPGLGGATSDTVSPATEGSDLANYQEWLAEYAAQYNINLAQGDTADDPIELYGRHIENTGCGHCLYVQILVSPWSARCIHTVRWWWWCGGLRGAALALALRPSCSPPRSRARRPAPREADGPSAAPPAALRPWPPRRYRR
jgi:hypothetical protein